MISIPTFQLAVPQSLAPIRNIPRHSQGKEARYVFWQLPWCLFLEFPLCISRVLSTRTFIVVGKFLDHCDFLNYLKSFELSRADLIELGPPSPIKNLPKYEELTSLSVRHVSCSYESTCDSSHEEKSGRCKKLNQALLSV